jgi:threonyl-tRNA synthetase
MSPDCHRRSEETSILIHRAIRGSVARFLGVVLEHYIGHFPLWLSPKQIVVYTIMRDADDYAGKVTAPLANGVPRSRAREVET